MKTTIFFQFLIVLIIFCCTNQSKNQEVNLTQTAPDTTAVFNLPSESFVHEPEKAFSPKDRWFKQSQLIHFYDVPGEFGYILEGGNYGFENLSVIMTETYPGGGPPLHTHAVEEAHILQKGTYTIMIGDSATELTGPVIVRIPSNTPHCFYNSSEEIINLIGILPEPSISYEELGPNPLIAKND